MPKICYVIMPYGGDDEAAKKRFKSIYNAIIKPAAESKGYTVIREDHEARQGNIGANIVKSLAEADIVIADLSMNNWNVGYELGIRHALNKNGTILIVDNMTPLMFDIQGNKVIKYSHDWYECIEETHQQITEAITYCENNKTSSDSPVHDVYPKFSRQLIDYLTDNNDKEKEIIAALTQENAKLKETLDNAGLSADSDSSGTDIVSALRNAIGRSQYSGDKALLKLREKLTDEKEFVDFLGEALTKGFFTEGNLNSIYRMCIELDNYFVTIAFLEEAVRIYPDNEELSGRLAREYARNYENRDKAVFTVNKIIGIKKIDGKYTAEKKIVSDITLASLFDVYLTLDKYADLKEIAFLLLDMYPKYSALIKRNIVYSYIGLEEYELAEKIASELTEVEPSAINHYALYRVYRLDDNHRKAYEQIEHCIRYAPDDEDYCIYMAGLILDSCCIRTSEYSEPIKVSRQQAIAAAIPFVFRAYENGYEINKCLAFLQKNSLKESMNVLYNAAKNGYTSIPKMADTYDYYPLDCIFNSQN